MDGALSFPSHPAGPSALSNLGLALFSALAGAVVATWCSSEQGCSLHRLLRSLRSSKPGLAGAQQPDCAQHAAQQHLGAAKANGEAGRPPPRVRSTNSLGAAAAWVQGIEALPGCRKVFDAAQLLEGGQGGMADILGDVGARSLAGAGAGWPAEWCRGAGGTHPCSPASHCQLLPRPVLRSLAPRKPPPAARPCAPHHHVMQKTRRTTCLPRLWRRACWRT